MQPTTKEIVSHIFLIEFYEKLTRESNLINRQQLNSWCNYFDKHPHSGIPSTYHIVTEGVECTFQHNYINVINQMKRSIHHLPIFRILELGKGKICLCDINILCRSNTLFLVCINFYFHSCTIVEATNLLMQSLNFLKESQEIHCYFTDIYCNVTHETIGAIRFHLGIFKDRSDILRNLGPAIIRHGYDSELGYFSTISGAITTAMKAFPIDSNFQNMFPTFNGYLDCDILFPGFNKDFTKGDRIILSNGKIEYSKYYPQLLLNEEEETSTNDLEPVSMVVGDVPILFYCDNFYKKQPSISEWIPGYQPSSVGIDNDRYAAFYNCRNKFNINDDIFRMLCSYWLIAEVENAKKRLLSLSN